MTIERDFSQQSVANNWGVSCAPSSSEATGVHVKRSSRALKHLKHSKPVNPLLKHPPWTCFLCSEVLHFHLDLAKSRGARKHRHISGGLRRGKPLSWGQEFPRLPDHEQGFLWPGRTGRTNFLATCLWGSESQRDPPFLLIRLPCDSQCYQFFLNACGYKL